MKLLAVILGLILLAVVVPIVVAMSFSPRKGLRPDGGWRDAEPVVTA